MSFPYNKVKTVVTGELITASDRNSEHDNHINNNIPENTDDYSTNTTEMQINTDPYPAGSPSLATSLSEEIERLRYLIKQITGETQWYIDPDTDMVALKSGTVVANLNADMVDGINGVSLELISGHNSSVSAYTNIAQGITGGSGYEKLTFATEQWDSLNEFDNVTNHRFTAQASGKYLINFKADVESTTATFQAFVEIYKNGAGIDFFGELTVVANVSYYPTIACSVLLNLIANDYIEIYAEHNNATNTRSFVKKYLQIQKVSN